MLCQKTRESPSGKPFGGDRSFATHPVHTEVMAWVGAVTDLSFAFFFLLGFHFHLRSGAPAWDRFRLLSALYIPALGESVFAERYLYLPSAGFVLLLAAAFAG